MTNSDHYVTSYLYVREDVTLFNKQQQNNSSNYMQLVAGTVNGVS